MVAVGTFGVRVGVDTGNETAPGVVGLAAQAASAGVGMEASVGSLGTSDIEAPGIEDVECGLGIEDFECNVAGPFAVKEVMELVVQNLLLEGVWAVQDFFGVESIPIQNNCILFGLNDIWESSQQSK